MSNWQLLYNANELWPFMPCYWKTSWIWHVWTATNITQISSKSCRLKEFASWIYLKPNLEHKVRIMPPRCKYAPPALGQTAIVKLSNLILLQFFWKDISSAELRWHFGDILRKHNDAWFQNFCICQRIWWWSAVRPAWSITTFIFNAQ